jgi:hypothetical protein
LQDFWAEAEDFAHHPNNCGLLRQRLRIRVSARRLRRLLKETFRVPGAETTRPSTAPWPSGDPAPVSDVTRPRLMIPAQFIATAHRATMPASPRPGRGG